MAQYVLTILDTISIQNYIFGSNRLRENIGASELVKQATQDWVRQCLPKPNNVTQPSLTIERDQLQAELIYAGGGNTMIMFDTVPRAKTFVTELSERLLTDAPGLDIAVVHQPFKWENDSLGGSKKGVVHQAMMALANRKRNQPVHRPLSGLSVTAECQSTGFVAITTDEGYVPGDEPTKLISAEIEAKLKKAQSLNTKTKRDNDEKYFSQPLDFDELGRSHSDTSYVAVIHADGNGFGDRIEKIAQDYPSAPQNREYLQALQNFSNRVENASKVAWEQTEQRILASFQFDDEKEAWMMASTRFDEQNKNWLRENQFPLYQDKAPFRLLVRGGDDLTFVCDGRLALTMTEFYLRAFEKQFATETGPYLPGLTACAGMAIVKTHYPFVRAYQLAEELCSNAKKWMREQKQGSYFSALDWHFAPSGLMGDIDTIRQREYPVADSLKQDSGQHSKREKKGGLALRPIALRSENGGWRNWSKFVSVLKEFKYHEDWANKRNKVKQLREALRSGPNAVQQFRIAYCKSNSLPEIDASDLGLQESGWSGDNYCGYFDAIEAMEFFVPIETEDK